MSLRPIELQDVSELAGWAEWQDGKLAFVPNNLRWSDVWLKCLGRLRG